MPTRRDYDSNPDRFRTGARLAAANLSAGVSLYGRIAAILRGGGVERVLDVGCGEGALAAAVDKAAWVVGLDASLTMLHAVPAPAVQAEATALPFRSEVFDAVVAVNVYDHLPDPLPALRAARQVLRRGGIMVAGAVSRFDSPELADIWRPTPTPFDAEDAPKLIAQVFADVDVEAWDAPLLDLPDRSAVTDFLISRFVPEEQAIRVAARIRTPVTLTKRGALIWAYR